MDKKSCSQKTGSGDEQLAMLFRKASKMMSRAHHRHAHTQHAQAHVYSLVKERGPISQKELMQILDVRSSSLSEILKKLEHCDLIVREKNLEDKRGFIVQIKEGVIPQFAEQEEKQEDGDFLFAALDEEEKQQLASLLKKLIASAKDDEVAHRCHHHGKKYKKGGLGHHHHKDGGGRKKGGRGR